MAHIDWLWIALVALVLISCFFSLAETAFMSVNRYRIRHLARHGLPVAKRVSLLLERPDRLLGVILLGDTFADILASAIATIIAIHYFGEVGVLIATAILTLIVLVFGELAPKTLAALYPTPIVFSSAYPLWLLLKILYPLVWLLNILSNGLLRIFGVRSSTSTLETLSTDELRTIVKEANNRIPAIYQKMLLQLLDLEKAVVEDIMIPRSEIIGININDDWSEILTQLTTNQHTRLPLYEENIDHILGIIHLRDALNLLAQENLTKETLLNIIEPPYFIPESTTLAQQVLNFSKNKQRISFAVDEYGDIQGLVTIEDILEEIVGEFTTDTIGETHKEISEQHDGSFVIDGGINIRELNRALHFHLPTNGPKTLSGLIIDQLEMIPNTSVCLRINNYFIEVLQTKDNMIKAAKIKIHP